MCCYMQTSANVATCKLVRKRILMEIFIESQFGYSLVWMYCNWNCNHRVNHLHERALTFVYNDYVSSLEIYYMDFS